MCVWGEGADAYFLDKWAQPSFSLKIEILSHIKSETISVDILKRVESIIGYKINAIEPYLMFQNHRNLKPYIIVRWGNGTG